MALENDVVFSSVNAMVATMRLLCLPWQGLTWMARARHHAKGPAKAVGPRCG